MSHLISYTRVTSLCKGSAKRHGRMFYSVTARHSWLYLRGKSVWQGRDLSDLPNELMCNLAALGMIDTKRQYALESRYHLI